MMASIIVYVLMIASLASGLQIELLPGDMRCVGQELDQFESVVFASSASSAVRNFKQKLTMKVSDPDEETIFEEKISINSKLREIEHKVEKRGVYQMCFELLDGTTPVRVFFHVDYKPKADRRVGKEDVSTLEKQVFLMGERIREISKEIEHARLQELAMKAAGESTTASVQWFGILSIAVLLSTSIWQIMYLRSFFASKKLL
ncbi:emp24/gp25L/p24 family/GOLD-domain-containing protein [Ochromonadaceae sp. CCMP2298]|nr:emp24/gp25L/p24 family/GOLD-domain-containing protein [Ochromonadaceae sp. CCMP2298]|mmetsp:Transcript_29566/g.65553  ORF Transcript_29566/g.65553 Transcript_29566/m.65553 type:complete len:203 (-) Transcript_29566:85-693(-)